MLILRVSRMQVETTQKKMPNNIVLENREKLSVGGVLEVNSFDSENVIMNTSYGELTIRGENLNISDFDVKTGDLSLTGNIVAMYYSTEKRTDHKQSAFAKLFK